MTRIIHHPSLIVLSIIASLCGNTARAAEPEVFNNPTVGFQITKPADWHYFTAAQNLENSKDTKLTDEQTKAALEKYATAPLVILTKFKEPYEDLNPSVKVVMKSYGSLQGKTPAEIIALVLPQLQRSFQDFVVIQPTKEVELSGIKSDYTHVHYTAETSAGERFTTSSEFWVVPHGDYFFMITAGTRQDEKTGTREDIRKIIDTIKIQP